MKPRMRRSHPGTANMTRRVGSNLPLGRILRPRLPTGQQDLGEAWLGTFSGKWIGHDEVDATLFASFKIESKKTVWCHGTNAAAFKSLFALNIVGLWGALKTAVSNFHLRGRSGTRQRLPSLKPIKAAEIRRLVYPAIFFDTWFFYFKNSS